jgi:SAM-dependent methyltransferase
MKECLTYEDFSLAFGTQVGDIKEKVGALIDNINPKIKIISGEERDNLILHVLQKIDSLSLKSAGAERSCDWEDGWQENLDDFIASSYDIKSLKPKYYREKTPHRFLNEFVLPEENDFVYKYTEIFREWLFKTYLADYQTVYEFGCGTAHNLVHYARLFPDTKLFGLDWAKSSQKIIDLLREQLGLNIYGDNFNFFNPDQNLKLEENCAVFSFGALEQTGSNYKDYIEYIISQRPGICVDIAGINDFYSKDSLMDYIALSYHNRRNYLNCYYSYMKTLEEKGRISILKHHKHEFGNLYDDPYSYVIWKVL